MENRFPFPTLMITGLGNLGNHVLNMISKIPNNPINIVVTGRNEDMLLRQVNMAFLTASQFDLYPNIAYEILDLRNIEHTAEIVKKYNPNVIFNAASIQSWSKVTQLPQEVYKAIDKARLGPWLPMHLPLVYNLKKAIKLSGLDPFLINSAFPDIVNPTLHKIGLAPTVGIGNIANTIPAIRKSISTSINRPMKHISIRLITHHYTSHFISRHGYPNSELYYLRAYTDGEDITPSLDLKEIFNDIPIKYKRLVGIEGQPMTATSAIKVIMAALYNTDDLIHAPGPNGKPGGYPLRINSNNVRLDIPSHLPLEEAVAINERNQILEGVVKIDQNGNVHFNPENMQILKDMLGYECTIMKIEDSYEYAMELKSKYDNFANKFA